ncbi:hypothetical protein [Parasitella parasitica]|uniref:Retrotransposon gag domain-containing protein n=1 Tax=Parasitella parasitica TaxID=35722 RepID=A0A0B7NM30_9FUNG|nr:hypothetical protein [Parasitella parasitica]
MMNNIKVEAVDETVSMLVKGEPCCDENVSLVFPRPGSAAVRQAISENCGRPVVMPQAGPVNSGAKDHQTGAKYSSSSVEQITPSSKGPVNVNKQAGSLNSVSSTMQQKGPNDNNNVMSAAVQNMQSALRPSKPVNNQAVNPGKITTPDAVVRDGECSNKPIVVLNRHQKHDNGGNHNVDNMDNNTVATSVAGAAAVGGEQQALSSKSINQQNNNTTTSTYRSLDSNPPPPPLAKDVRKEEEEENAYAKRNRANLAAMQSVLCSLKAMITGLTLKLVSHPDRADLNQKLCATEKQISLVRRMIQCLDENNNAPNDVATTSVADENYKKLSSTLKLVPYFQWEGNITNKKEKVFLTIYACLRQVERAAKEYDFDIEAKWASLISTKLSSQMHHWLDNLLLRDPNCSWSAFKTLLLQEYEMPLQQAVQIMDSSAFNQETQTFDSFVSRFLMAFEYSRLPEYIGELYFLESLPTEDDQKNFN